MRLKGPMCIGRHTQNVVVYRRPRPSILFLLFLIFSPDYFFLITH